MQCGLHVQEIGWIEPQLAAELLRPLGGLAFLDSAMQHPSLGRHSYVAADPFGRLIVDGNRVFLNGRPVAGPPFNAVADLLTRFTMESADDLPQFQTGAIGVFGYEAGRLLERLPRPEAAAVGRMPEITLGLYDVVVAFDHAVRRAWIVSSGHPATTGERAKRATARAAALAARLAPAWPIPRRHAPSIGRAAWRSNFLRKDFEAAVMRVKEYILDGDIYQANISQRFILELPALYDPWTFYLKLRRRNAATFCAYLEDGDWAVASSSPERFLKVENGAVETRPIKGTAPRGVVPEEDARNAERLLASEKDRAENIMIVDLLRNDLSRVCRPHSVATPSLTVLETYAGVHHLVSSVTGQLSHGQSALDLLAAAFPGGSVTGVPKLRAMEIITELEREARGVYCGAIGCLGFNGFMDTSIAIRTVVFQNGLASFHAGGGITASSEPDAEYQETLDKAERILQAFEDEEPSQPCFS
ncbi:aminodeoxychorismate synthase component I [Microvirga calopogonii]|uniref:aminodeoxychorismate synthase component I n=1 Tax=Microvirga calopogonii TaxID=2078013 RepID=UPI000E0D25E3|nr:aminodeoxychorismate synthase component I [Microvirga calopogonii]